MWLRELVAPFVATVAALLKEAAPTAMAADAAVAVAALPPPPPPRRRPRVCVLAFRERATATSATFSTGANVLDAFRAAGCVATERGTCDAPESRGLPTTFYEIRVAAAVD